jgi:hypothetical protein
VCVCWWHSLDPSLSCFYGNTRTHTHWLVVLSRLGPSGLVEWASTEKTVLSLSFGPIDSTPAYYLPTYLICLSTTTSLWLAAITGTVPSSLSSVLQIPQTTIPLCYQLT